MALSYNLAYQEIISVYHTRRQIFAGKSDFTFWNIWEWVIYQKLQVQLRDDALIIRFALIDQKLQVQLHDDALMFDLWPLYLHLAASLPARKYLLITLHLSHHYDEDANMQIQTRPNLPNKKYPKITQPTKSNLCRKFASPQTPLDYSSSFTPNH